VKPAFRLLLDLLLIAAVLTLAAVLLSPASRTPGPISEIADALPNSGVSHPITAVLLNFRGYDTLLEMLVLLLALVGVRSLGALPPMPPAPSTSPVLLELLRDLAPLLVLVAIYVLWRGSSGPGGAFQAGALLGAAGVLFLLTERPTADAPAELPLKPLLALGVSAFALMALALAMLEGALLAYPAELAGALIFCIEALATASIAATLLALFVGARSRDD
jgi:multisubunit Na+/H+ antiporter MnhB subunit